MDPDWSVANCTSRTSGTLNSALANSSPHIQHHGVVHWAHVRYWQPSTFSVLIPHFGLRSPRAWVGGRGGGINPASQATSDVLQTQRTCTIS